MEQLVDEEIVCVFDNDNQTPIFDKDQWESQPGLILSTKSIVQKQNDKENTQMIQKVREQVQKSKQNFFKVDIVKKPVAKGKKQTQSKTKQTPLNKSNKINTQASKAKNSILKEGYLNKKTDGFIFKWHRRFLVLTSEKLFSFSNQKKHQLIGCVNLKLLSAKVKQNTDKQIVLDFMGECENLILKADSQEEIKSWKKWIKHVIEYQSKQNKIMIQTLVKPIYQSKDSISEKQFIQSAETGDILLFYTKNTGAQLQRIFTNSDFDHVAMVVKFRKNELMVFQSNQMYGVSIYDWRQYIQYFDLYHKVTLRKLNYIKKADVQNQLLNFVKNTVGKNYELNVNKFLTFQSDVDWQKINKQKNQQRGYFCSELIAKALKSVGLLDQKKSSGRYWPVDFAQKSGMLLKKNAFLDRQQSIILNKHLKNYI